ncbi:MAG: fibronectin type III domain-containing protein, partial [Tepidisphaeraceae bacterium]
MQELLTSRRVTFENVTTDTPVVLSDPVFSADGKSATFTFPEAVSFAEVTGALPDGWYRVVVSSEDVPATVDLVSDFVFRTGDTNSDGTIDLDDFSVIEGGFLLGLTGYSNGDFNYSGGTPDLDDFAIIEGAFLTTLYPPPTAPNEIVASALSDSSLILNWADTVHGEAGWRVQWSTDNQNFEVYQNLDPDTTNLTVTGLPDGTRTWWRVRAFGNGQDTAYTPKKGATTALLAPSGLSASSDSDTQITLFWEDNSGHELEFVIESANSESGSWTPMGTAPANSASFSDSTLSALATRYYRVSARNAVSGALSAPSNTASATTLPAPPLNLTATAVSQSQVNLTWSYSGSATAFEITRSDSRGEQTSWQVGGAARSYNNTGLTDGTTYTYSLHALTTQGASNESNQASATTMLAAPDQLVVTTNNDSHGLELGFRDNSQSEDNFEIEFAGAIESAFEPLDTIGAPAATGNVTYTVSDLSQGQYYFFRVRARNSDAGESAWAAGEQAVSAPTIPAPSSLSATAVSPREINLTWQDNSDGEDVVRVERFITGPFAAWVPTAELEPNATGYTVRGLNPQTTYTFRIVASRPFQTTESEPSNEVSATTLADTHSANPGGPYLVAMGGMREGTTNYGSTDHLQLAPHTWT